MPTIPTPANQGAAPLGAIQVNPLNPEFQNLTRPDMASNSRIIGDLGATLGQIAQQKADRDTERRLLDTQAGMDKLEDDLFDPQTGIYTVLQGDAVGLTAAVNDRLDQFDEEWGNGDDLSHSGKIALEEYLRNARVRITDRVQTHETTEDQKWRVTQFETSIDGMVDKVSRDALSVTTEQGFIDNSKDFRSAVLRMTDTVELRADAQGINPKDPDAAEALKQTVEAYISEMTVARVLALATNNPSLAMAALEAAVDEIDPQDYTKVYNAIDAAVIDSEGFIEGSAGILIDIEARRNGTDYDEAFWATHTFGGALRPDALTETSPVLLGATQNMIEGAPDHIAAGLGLTSGYRSDELQQRLYDNRTIGGIPVAKAGSSQHNFGNAVDLSWNGGSFTNAPQEVKNWVRDHAGDYGLVQPVAGDSMHIELQTNRDNPYSAYSAGVQHVMNIEDPEIRKSALGYFSSQQAFLRQQDNIALADLLDDVTTRIYQGKADADANGTDMGPLSNYITPAQIAQAGSSMPALQSIYNNVKTGNRTTSNEGLKLFDDITQMSINDSATLHQFFEDNPTMTTYMRSVMSDNLYDRAIAMQRASQTHVDAQKAALVPDWAVLEANGLTPSVINSLLGALPIYGVDDDEKEYILNVARAELNRELLERAANDQPINPTIGASIVAQLASRRDLPDGGEGTTANAMYEANEKWGSAQAMLDDNDGSMDFLGLSFNAETLNTMVDVMGAIHNRPPTAAEFIWAMTEHATIEATRLSGGSHSTYSIESWGLYKSSSNTFGSPVTVGSQLLPPSAAGDIVISPEGEPAVAIPRFKVGVSVTVDDLMGAMDNYAISTNTLTARDWQMVVNGEALSVTEYRTILNRFLATDDLTAVQRSRMLMELARLQNKE